MNSGEFNWRKNSPIFFLRSRSNTSSAIPLSTYSGKADRMGARSGVRVFRVSTEHTKSVAVFQHVVKAKLIVYQSVVVQSLVQVGTLAKEGFE